MNQLSALSTRLDSKIEGVSNRLDTKIDGLSTKLAEEFRAQRADQAAQISALANVVTAVRQQAPQVILVPASGVEPAPEGKVKPAVPSGHPMPDVDVPRLPGSNEANKSSVPTGPAEQK